MEKMITPEDMAAIGHMVEGGPVNQKKEKRMVTVRSYPHGPYVRQHPKNVKKAFKELSRAISSSKEFGAAFLAGLATPMLAVGIPQETAEKAAVLIVAQMFQFKGNGNG